MSKLLLIIVTKTGNLTQTVDLEVPKEDAHDALLTKINTYKFIAVDPDYSKTTIFIPTDLIVRIEVTEVGDAKCLK